VKEVADMHVAPPMRRWVVRLGLALFVAIGIGYLPGQMLRRDPRAIKLAAQLAELRAEAKVLAAGNATLLREIEALRTDVGAIETRARADLGMVYPDEIVLRVRRLESTHVEPPFVEGRDDVRIVERREGAR
jgi:cell division protein FtsB